MAPTSGIVFTCCQRYRFKGNSKLAGFCDLDFPFGKFYCGESYMICSMKRTFDAFMRIEASGWERLK